MATLQEIVEKYKIDEADSGSLSGLIEAEKQKGLLEAKKKGKEFTELLTKHNALRDGSKLIGIDPDGNLVEQVTTIKEKLEKAGKPPEGGTAQEIEARLTNQFEKRFKELDLKRQKEVDDEKAAKAAVELKFRNSKIKEIAKKQFGEQLLLPDLQIKDWINDGKLKLGNDDTLLGVDGDEDIDAKKWFDGFVKQNPEAIKSNQAPGSGGGSGKPDLKKVKELSEDHFNSLSLPEQADFRRGGGKVKES